MRLRDLQRLYQLVEQLKQGSGGLRMLSTLRNDRWPARGVYFFFEPGEVRRETGEGFRLVRVGTHALTTGSKSTFRQRLHQHRGSSKGGGNHRGSIFRLLIGQALMSRGDLPTCPSWGVKGDARQAAAVLELDHDQLASAEAPIELAVTQYLSALPFLWLDVDDAPGPDSQRGTVERNAIALLSNHAREPFDLPSGNWLGHYSDRPLVRSSGLWNQRHVTETHDPAFLDVFERLVDAHLSRWRQGGDTRPTYASGAQADDAEL
jgi:hypothetical protein